PATPAEFTLRSPGMGSTREIPAGDYDVEAYDLDPDSPEENAAIDRLIAEQRAHNRWGYRLAAVHGAFGLGGLLHLVSFVALAILVIFFLSDRRAGWLLLESNWGWIYRGLLAVWIVRIALGLLPPVRAFHRAIAAERDQHPLTIIILERRGAPPEKWQGVVFGPE